MSQGCCVTLPRAPSAERALDVSDQRPLHGFPQSPVLHLQVCTLALAWGSSWGSLAHSICPQAVVAFPWLCPGPLAGPWPPVVSLVRSYSGVSFSVTGSTLEWWQARWGGRCTVRPGRAAGLQKSQSKKGECRARSWAAGGWSKVLILS